MIQFKMTFWIIKSVSVLLQTAISYNPSHKLIVSLCKAIRFLFSLSVCFRNVFLCWLRIYIIVKMSEFQFPSSVSIIQLLEKLF